MIGILIIDNMILIFLRLKGKFRKPYIFRFATHNGKPEFESVILTYIRRYNSRNYHTHNNLLLSSLQRSE